jgi:hypothetical protein
VTTRAQHFTSQWDTCLRGLAMVVRLVMPRRPAPVPVCLYSGPDSIGVHYLIPPSCCPLASARHALVD